MTFLRLPSGSILNLSEIAYFGPLWGKHRNLFCSIQKTGLVMPLSKEDFQFIQAYK